MIYILCNVETGELLRISEQPIEASGAPLLVRAIDRPMPDLTKHEWVPNLLDFQQTPGLRTITKLQYLRRFTNGERIGIRAAAKAEPILEDYLALLELAEEINLDDPDTVAALQMLEAGGLIASGRAAEILA